jgi:hypothetical protein
VSALAYAPVPGARIAAVMSFTQEVTPEADRAMAAMTERLIEAVLALDGSFYLPYRLHARPEQVRASLSRVRCVHRQEALLRSASAVSQSDVGQVFYVTRSRAHARRHHQGGLDAQLLFLAVLVLPVLHQIIDHAGSASVEVSPSAP